MEPSIIITSSPSPSPPPSLSSTPSAESATDSPPSLDPDALQTMARMRFLASQWKRRSLSGHTNFRSSRDLKAIFDTLDTASPILNNNNNNNNNNNENNENNNEPSTSNSNSISNNESGSVDLDNKNLRLSGRVDRTASDVERHVAIEAEALKREVADTRSESSQDDMMTSTSSFHNVSGSGDDSEGIRRADSRSKKERDQKQKGGLFRRVKKSLGISSDVALDNNKDDPVYIFNSGSPGEGIQKLITAGVLEHDPSSVAEFFHINDTLNKFKIGEYLGTLNDFNIKVLHELVRRFDFTCVDFDIALRHLLYCFRLPGEAQKINRIMDAFGSHFFTSCSNSVFVNADAAQVMAFSAIMLTTDAHNPRVLEKMTKTQFVTLTRGMNGEGNFPKDFLEYMFEKVVDEPLIRIDHTTTLLPYSIKRGWVYVTRRKSWKRYYGLLSEGSVYLQRKPLDSKWRKRITGVKLVSPEVQRVTNAPTQFCVAISGIGEGVDVGFMAFDSNRDVQGWINVMPSS